MTPRQKFLREKGNPFIAVGVDPESNAIMDLGVYGAPKPFSLTSRSHPQEAQRGDDAAGLARRV